MSVDPSHLTVLILDARLDRRMALRDLCGRAGIRTIRLAADFAEAVERLRCERVHAVLLDDEWRPGALDFLHALRRKARGAIQETPVVLIVTADGPAVRAARDAGVNELVARPASAVALRERFEEILVRPRPFIRAAGYVGPCRRRRRIESWEGTERRQAVAAARD